MPRTAAPLRRLAGRTTESLYARHYRRGSPLYVVTLLVILATLAALPFISVPVGSSTRATLRTRQQPVELSVAVSGRIISTRLRENRAVRAGDTLLVIDRSELQLETEHLRDGLAEDARNARDLRAAIAALASGAYPSLETALYQRDYQEYRHAYDAAKLEVTHAANQLARQEKLFATGTIAAMEIERYRFEHELAATALARVTEQRRHLWTQELRRYERELGTQRRQLQTLHQRARRFVLLAPLAGDLTGVTGLAPGAYVGAGQVVAGVSPRGHLEVALHLSPQDIGLVREGTAVTLRLDAFHHTQWGVAHAEIEDIGHDAIIGADGAPGFVATARLLNDRLVLPGGQEGRLKKGMTAAAHLTLTHRTLAQLLRDRVYDWIPQP